MDKTVKIKAFADPANGAVQMGKGIEGDISLELAMKDAQIEEERNRSLEHLKTIVQLRESLKLEQAKVVEFARRMAELETRVKDMAALDSGELAKKSAQLDEERKKNAEQARMIEQLQAGLKQEQEKLAEALRKQAGLAEAEKEKSVLEAKLRTMVETLDKIAALASLPRPQ